MNALLKFANTSEDPNSMTALDEGIAEGSYGQVYKGRILNGSHFNPNGKDIQCAIKIVPVTEEDDVEELAIEIEVMSRSCHDNIVKYFGSWLFEGELFIAMELCDGGSIADIYTLFKAPLREKEICAILYETVKGLLHLHELGYIHRDLKGANILLKADGSLKIIDFGVSGRFTEEARTRTTFIGTPYWMAPEVIENNVTYSPYDCRADVWSLGILVVEFAEAKPPLIEVPPMKVIYRIASDPPLSLSAQSSWSAQMRNFVSICLVKNPLLRPFCEDLLKHEWFIGVNPKDSLASLIHRYLVSPHAQELVSDDSDDLSDISSFPKPPPIILKPPEKASMSNNIPLAGNNRLGEPTSDAVGTAPSPLNKSEQTRPQSVIRKESKRTLLKKKMKVNESGQVNQKTFISCLKQTNRLKARHKNEMDKFLGKLNNEKEKETKVMFSMIQKENQTQKREDERFGVLVSTEKDTYSKMLTKEQESTRDKDDRQFKAWDREMQTLIQNVMKEFDEQEKNKKTLSKLEKSQFSKFDSNTKKYAKQLAEMVKLHTFEQNRFSLEISLELTKISELASVHLHAKEEKLKRLLSLLNAHFQSNYNEFVNNLRIRYESQCTELELFYQSQKLMKEKDEEILRQKHELLNIQSKALFEFEFSQHKMQQNSDHRKPLKRQKKKEVLSSQQQSLEIEQYAAEDLEMKKQQEEHRNEILLKQKNELENLSKSNQSSLGVLQAVNTDQLNDTKKTFENFLTKYSADNFSKRITFIEQICKEKRKLLKKSFVDASTLLSTKQIERRQLYTEHHNKQLKLLKTRLDVDKKLSQQEKEMTLQAFQGKQSVEKANIAEAEREHLRWMKQSQKITISELSNEKKKLIADTKKQQQNVMDNLFFSQKSI